MIPQSIKAWQTLSWQEELRSAVTDASELLSILELDRRQLTPIQQASLQFPLRVPRSFLARIRPGDPADPLLLQILPASQELQTSPGYSDDPLEEGSSNPLPGLVHKYRGRVLLIVSPACAVNCRYCFRRHFDYAGNTPGRVGWQPAIDYIAADSSITEVIYSGGDPLAANDRQLRWLTERLADISHLQRLRVHSRLPVVMPSRIDEDCLSWLTASRLKPLMVIHSNHANEIDQQVRDAVSRLSGAGIPVLNQSVLLRDINDSVPALARLSETLFDAGVLPYYLHLLDPVRGAAHFAVEVERARQIFAELHALLPGYLLPRLVQERPSAPGKTLLCGE